MYQTNFACCFAWMCNLISWSLREEHIAPFCKKGTTHKISILQRKKIVALFYTWQML